MKHLDGQTPAGVSRNAGSGGAGAELAYEQIRTAIVEGRYRPGQRLVEQHIAAEFDLSRTPVREALRRLDSEGLVVIERNRGAIVRTVSMTEIADLYQLRGRLESYAAELAATRASAPEIQEIRDAVEGFGDVHGAANHDDIERIRTLNLANRRIHDAILGAAHHDRLSAMLARTVDIPLVFHSFRTFVKADHDRSNLFHHLIADAIEARDGKRAERLMAEHICQGLQVVLSAVDEAGIPT
jgi:DNA-binding GntR family transcriptional regulator